MYSREITASGIVESTFEKVAKSTTEQGTLPKYDAALRKAGVKNKDNPFKQQAKHTKNAFKAGARTHFKDSVTGFAKSKKGKAIGLAAGLGIAGGGAALAMNKSRQKTAFDVVDETFEKIAKLNYAAKKPLGKAIKNTLNGSNIKSAINDISVASRAGASASTLRGLKRDRNKQIAKTVGAYGTGAAGLGGSAYGITSKRRDTE